MIINLRDYLNEYIGDISWYGETNHDDKSLENMEKARQVLYFLKNVECDILNELYEHRHYRIGNYSASILHAKAKEICKNYDNEYNEEEWEIHDEK